MALYFTGVSGANNVDMGPNRDYFRNVEGGTLMGWVTYDSLGTSRSIIGVSIGTGTGTRAKISTPGSANTVELRARRLDADTSSTVTTTTTLVTGRRYHIAGVFDYSEHTGLIYIDGELDTIGVFSTLTDGATSNTSAQTGTVGANEPGTGNPWHGAIEDVRVYNRALGPHEIRSIFAARGSDNILQDLFARWTFNEFAPGVAGGEIPDLTDNRNVAVTVGSLSYVAGTLKLNRPKRMVGALHR